MVATHSGVDVMWDELIRMANAQYETPQFRRLFSTSFNLERARQFSIQMAHYVKNRRDCWAYVQAGAPLDVKKIIWAHEQEELAGDEEAGKPDHFTLAIQEGQQVLGLTPEDFEHTPVADGPLTCFYAWLHLARSRNWLETLGASAILEIRNSDEFIEDGAMSRRIGEKWAAELGIPLKEQVNHAEHVEADVEHAHMLLGIARRHAQGAAEQEAILRGARESLVIDRVFRGHLAELITTIP